jgi:putative PIN family toxin of toxin-antitoxin system
VRVALDTNVVVSAILFTKGHLTWLREGWSTGRFLPLIDTPCAKELLRVLAYPKFRLMPDDIQTLLGTYLPFTEAVNTAGAKTSRLPRCRDPHDRKFLVLAQEGKADVLVTGDQALLALARQTPFAIETPSVFLRRFEK